MASGERYKITSPSGSVAYTYKRPTDGTPYLVCTPNGTVGKICEAPTAAAERAAEALRKQRAGIAQLNARDQRALDKATAECDATVGAQNDKRIAEANARVDAATARLTTAGKNVIDAREALGKSIRSLNKVRNRVAIGQSAVGLALDLVPARRVLALIGVPVASFANSVIKGEPGDALLGAGVDGVGEAVRRTDAAAVAAAAAAAAAAPPGAPPPGPVAMVRGTGALGAANTFKGAADLIGDIRSPDFYDFTKPDDVGLVKDLRSQLFGAEGDPRGVVEKLLGPDRDKLKKELDDLIAAMEEELAAKKELDDALAARNKTDAFPGEEGTCINKRQHELTRGQF